MGAGRAFKQVLDNKGVSVNELSAKSGVSQQTIYSFINRDSNRIDINAFIKLCKAIDVSPELFENSFLEEGFTDRRNERLRAYNNQFGIITPDQEYYPEQYIEMLKYSPMLRKLLDIAKDSKDSDIMMVIDILNRLNGK